MADDREAQALADLSFNPGVDAPTWLECARETLARFPFPQFTYRRQQTECHLLAKRKLAEAPTEKIENRTRGHVFSMLEYEPAELPVQSEQFRPDEPDPAA